MIRAWVDAILKQKKEDESFLRMLKINGIYDNEMKLAVFSKKLLVLAKLVMRRNS